MPSKRALQRLSGKSWTASACSHSRRRQLKRCGGGEGLVSRYINKALVKEIKRTKAREEYPPNGLQRHDLRHSAQPYRLAMARGFI
jgi:hypothetical protein